MNFYSCCGHCRIQDHREQGEARYGPDSRAGHPIACRRCRPGEQGRLRVDDPTAVRS